MENEKVLNNFHLHGMGGCSESERISCQTQLIMHCLDYWGKYKRWLKLQYLIHKKLLKKLYLQGMQGGIESEGISYQTPILRIKKLIWEGNSKIRNY